MGNELATEAHAKLVVFVNGVRHNVDPSVDPSQSLSAYLRSPAVAVTSSKVGCGTGYCGACTVMVSRRGDDGVIQHRAINACITPIALVDHCHVTTAEASGVILKRVKESFAANGAAQCGFCTPGFVMRIYAELRSSQGRKEGGGRERMSHLLDGNLCRCTGYRPILEAAADVLLAPSAVDYDDEGELIFPSWLQLNAPKVCLISSTIWFSFLHIPFFRILYFKVLDASLFDLILSPVSKRPYRRFPLLG